MPLTKNLYREDEVLAALQFSILRGRCVDAAFWCEELLESEMAEALLKAMRQIWLYGFGIGALPWYRAFVAMEEAEMLDADEAMRLVVALARIGVAGGKDSTYIVMAGSETPPEQVTFCMVPRGLKGADSFFAAAILQGRTITAWRALPSIVGGTLSSVAEHKHGAAGISVLALCMEYPALIIAALCLPRGELEQRMAKPLPGMLSEVEDALEEWRTIEGMRQRRALMIPHDCLYWLTARGGTTVYVSSDKSLRGSLERPDKLWGSSYWDSVAEEYGGWEAIRDDPDSRETFYEVHFPDDIPDEWSAEARAKSHGWGSIQPGTEPSTEKFFYRWFGQIPSAVIWGEFDAAIKNIVATGWDDIQASVGSVVALNLNRIQKPLIVVVKPVINGSSEVSVLEAHVAPAL